MSGKRFYIKGRRGRVSEKDFITHIQKQSKLSKKEVYKRIERSKGNLNDTFIDSKRVRERKYEKTARKSRIIRDRKGRISNIDKETTRISKDLGISKDEALYVFTESMRIEKTAKKKKFSWKEMYSTIDKVGKEFAKISDSYEFSLDSTKVSSFADERRDYNYIFNGKKMNYIEFISAVNENEINLPPFYKIEYSLKIEGKDVVLNFDDSDLPESKEEEKGYHMSANGHVIIFRS